MAAVEYLCVLGTAWGWELASKYLRLWEGLSSVPRCYSCQRGLLGGGGRGSDSASQEPSSWMPVKELLGLRTRDGAEAIVLA